MSDGRSSSRDAVHGFNRDALLAAYSALNDVQLDYNERKWETVRTTATLALGILAAVGGLAAAVGSVAAGVLTSIAVAEIRDLTAVQELILGIQPCVGGLVLLLLAVILVVAGYFLRNWTNQNIARESRLQYYTEFPMYQIEKLLGLHQQVPAGVRWYEASPYIFDRKHRDSSYRSTIPPVEQKDPMTTWVEGRLGQHQFKNTIDVFTRIFFVVFICFAISLSLVAIGLLAAILFLAA